MTTTEAKEAIYILQAVGGEQSLPVDRELLMGRDPSCDLVLDKGQASRHHAKLRPAEDGLWVEDLGSTNGTYVNGERIEGPTLLKPGDELCGGASCFQLEIRNNADCDADATLLDTADATLRESSPGAQAHLPAAAATKESGGNESKSGASAEPASKAPPSWVLNNQQSVDGTAFISKDLLKDSLANSSSRLQSAEEVTEPTLIGNSDPVMGLRFQLIGEKNKWEIGRSPNADVMINDDSVSGAHAQIFFESGRWKLVDLMSANGTYANGKKCLSGYLSNGDIIRFGGVECAFVLPEAMETSGERADHQGDTAGEPPSAVKMAAIAFAATIAVVAVVAALLAQF